jgi:hypothetical protein
MKFLSWKTVGISVGSLLSVSYVLCVVYDLIFGQTMYRTWIGLLPGFEWIIWGTFFLGLAESFLYGIYFALVLVPLYNLLRDKFEAIA